ncbi:YjfB family protein [Cohnella sp. AR92]|uniref:YjfB family protein n=1 Tax=Cohnella sp. AR92 TaxID=648716 RepID=UPI000F8D8FBE|nr:YjfB family protein [Cohnella sp. AR92]RUS46444.1 putative motility protein [Cohnella sp. AR92]
MDIAALSAVMSQSTLSQSFGIKVLDMAMGQSEQQGQDLAQLMASSLDPNLGNKLDIRV